MKVGLFTDAPKHNLALMKIAAYHRANGDDVAVNKRLRRDKLRYASILYKRNTLRFRADLYGGPGFPDSPCLPPEIEQCRPDYTLFPVDFSLGYTYRPCPRRCKFCRVPTMQHPDTEHHSIHEFHDPIFKKICLLNNNTFADFRWRETFEEIWALDLAVIDENGYDLRLLDEEKVAALKRTRFVGQLHFAWDHMEHEKLILRGLRLLNRAHITGRLYVLIGYDTTREEDFYRCQKIIDHKCTPYIMPYNRTRSEKQFKRFIDSFMWRKYDTLEEAWRDYNAGPRSIIPAHIKGKFGLLK